MLSLILAVILSPRASAHLVSLAYPEPARMEADLLAVCRRESRCRRIGVHVTDQDLDGWGGQVRLGHLDATCQRWAPRTWTTRGAWGLSAASHWRYMPRCYQAWWLDVAIVSASIAASKITRECGRATASRWCPPPHRRARRRASSTVATR